MARFSVLLKTILIGDHFLSRFECGFFRSLQNPLSTKLDFAKNKGSSGFFHFNRFTMELDSNLILI